MIRQKSKTKEEIKRLETYNDRVMIKKLKGVDAALKDIDFDINIEVNKIGANVTGNQNFYELSNHRLLEVGLLNQVISIKKEGPILLMNMGGITVSTFFQFVEIYRFVKTYMQSVKAYITNFSVQTSQEIYEQFIKDIELV